MLESLSASAEPRTAAALAPRLRVPNPTRMRLMPAMEDAGHVPRAPADRRFVPGPRGGARAAHAARPQPAPSRRSILRRLETCNVRMPQGARVHYVERVETNEPLRLHRTPAS